MRRICASLVVTAAIIAGCSGDAGATPAATPDSEAEVLPTATITQIAVTATPVVECPDAEERAYIGAADTHMTLIGEAWSGLGSLLIDAGADSSLLIDDDWRSEVGLKLDTIDVYAEVLLGIDAPESMIGIERAVHSIAQDSQRAVELFIEGLDPIDAAVIDEATTALLRARATADDIPAMAEAFCD